VLERAKSSILPNGNFREFFPWRGEFCVFKTGIPGGPGKHKLYLSRELRYLVEIWQADRFPPS